MRSTARPATRRTPVFIADTYDISDLAGAKTPVLRFSYSTDPGLARPGWFIDDLVVTATTPSGKKVLLDADFEKTGGHDDPRVFNGGCQADSPGGKCTQGWQYVKAGAEADFDHAYYLEMRDRSGFDLAGNGQIDRDPIGWQPGLYLSYTDEAHGYGNAGTDGPPAQSPLDSHARRPAARRRTSTTRRSSQAAGRTSFSDSGKGHTSTTTPTRRQRVGQLGLRLQLPVFKVLSMRGQCNGPARANGDLTGNVRFSIGKGCGRFDYGYPTPVRTTTNTRTDRPDQGLRHHAARSARS